MMRGRREFLSGLVGAALSGGAVAAWLRSSPGDLTAAGVPCVPERRWSELLTGPDRDVVLPTDLPVVVDVAVAECRTLTIPQGAVLRFDPAQDQELQYGQRLDVAGVLIARPTSGLHVLSSWGIDEADYVGGDEGMATDPGIHVHSGGLLDLHGGLDRSVVVETGHGGRSHVMWHPTAGVPHLSDVDFVGLGPADVLGRYPLHLHRMDGASRGALSERVHVQNSGNRAFVPHASHGTTWLDCSAEDISGTAFWWDRSISWNDTTNSTNDTTVERMRISRVHVPPSGDGRFTLAGFELNRGTGNVMRGCTASHVNGLKNSAGFVWPGGEARDGDGVWVFEDNAAHHCARHGIYAWQNTNGSHVVSRFHAHDNGGWGISHGAYRNRYRYEDVLLERNGAGGVLLHANSNSTAPIVFTGTQIVDSPVGFSTTKHTQPAENPTRIIDPTFERVTVPLLGDADPSKSPDWVTVTGTTAVPVFSDRAHLDSAWTVGGVEYRP